MPQIENLKCSYIQLRFFKRIDFNYIEETVKIINNTNSRIVSIDFILPYDEEYTIEKINNFLSENSRVHSMIIYNSPIEKSYNAINQQMGYLLFVKRNIINEKSCGIINTEYFYTNIKLFTEYQKHNTCLNLKISIDKDGNIKNCPSMAESYGNIKDITLEEALNHPNFKKYWTINKDQIEVCKDCEFRHICTDCRAYIEDPNNVYSKPLKCGYNPYTNEWSEWSTNPLKQKAIDFYNMHELVKK